ncbi:MAG: TetR/AcrR family transcriptional regulator [Salinivirgaceae bacterium]|nr:TetR/AcrR family transcriptional regulator [Salinivirgaceae bacterium]
MSKEQNLESEILKSAEELFLENGFSGTSTTDIAKRVGCNQALVHYYFRTKENLFLQVFNSKVETILTTLQKPLLQQNAEFNDKLRNAIGAYFDFLTENSRLPFFVINELLCNRERLKLAYNYFMQNTSRSKVFETIDNVVQTEVGKGTIRPIKTVDFVLDIVSLTVFNFIIMPIYKAVSDSTESEKAEFINSRKEDIITLVINGIKC